MLPRPTENPIAESRNPRRDDHCSWVAAWLTSNRSCRSQKQVGARCDHQYGQPRLEWPVWHVQFGNSGKRITCQKVCYPRIPGLAECRGDQSDTTGKGHIMPGVNC